MARHIFHLSLPVSDLDIAAAFYGEVLGGEIGRRTPTWLDVRLWGHQLTLQLQPEHVRSLEAQGLQHFGVVLPWAQWEATVARLDAQGVRYLKKPEVLYAGEAQEQAKLYLTDPANHVIELKAYRDVVGILGLES